MPTTSAVSRASVPSSTICGQRDLGVEQDRGRVVAEVADEVGLRLGELLGVTEPGPSGRPSSRPSCRCAGRGDDEHVARRCRDGGHAAAFEGGELVHVLLSLGWRATREVALGVGGRSSGGERCGEQPAPRTAPLRRRVLLAGATRYVGQHRGAGPPDAPHAGPAAGEQGRRAGGTTSSIAAMSTAISSLLCRSTAPKISAGLTPSARRVRAQHAVVVAGAAHLDGPGGRRPCRGAHDAASSSTSRPVAVADPAQLQGAPHQQPGLHPGDEDVLAGDDVAHGVDEVVGEPLRAAKGSGASSTRSSTSAVPIETW